MINRNDILVRQYHAVRAIMQTGLSKPGACRIVCELEKIEKDGFNMVRAVDVARAIAKLPRLRNAGVFITEKVMRARRGGGR